jgi:hypothetical protein
MASDLLEGFLHAFMVSPMPGFMVCPAGPHVADRLRVA